MQYTDNILLTEYFKTALLHTIWYTVMLLLLVCFERLSRVLTPSCAAPFTNLRGAPFEPLALPSRWTGTENAPLHLAKWQPLIMRTILFDTGQTPKTFYSPLASCWLNTPVQLQRELNKVGTGRKGRWLKRQLDDGEVQLSRVTGQKEKKAAGPFYLLIKYSRL